MATFNCDAQKWTSSFFANSTYSLYDDYEYIQVYETIRYLFVDVNLFTKNEVLILNKSRRTYASNSGAELGGNIDYHLNQKLSIFSGLSLQYGGTRIKNEFVSSELLNILSVDTVMMGPPVFGGGVDCDIQVPFDFSSLDRTTRLNMLHLAIPLGATIHLIPNKLSLRLQAIITTPIASTVTAQRIRSKVEENDAGQRVCSNHIENSKDKSGQLLNDLSLSTGLNIEYRFLDRIGIQLGASRGMSNLFHNYKFNSTANIANKTKSTSVFIGIRYYLSNVNAVAVVE